jgi:hypothetical protein
MHFVTHPAMATNWSGFRRTNLSLLAEFEMKPSICSKIPVGGTATGLFGVAGKSRCRSLHLSEMQAHL